MPHKCINPMSHFIISSSSSDPVPKPDITIKKIQEMKNSCYLILSCMAQHQSVNYTWYGDSGRISEPLQSSVLNITVMPQNYSTFYKCEVSNPVSHNSDTVYFTSYCKLGKKYSQGSWGGFRVTSSLFNEERCGDPFKFSWYRIWWRESQRHLGDSGSTHGSANTSQGTHLTFMEISVLLCKGQLHSMSTPRLL